MAGWEADSVTLKCKDCETLYRPKGKQTPCAKCEMPILMKENMEVYAIAKRAISMSIDGMSGRIDAGGIDGALTSAGILPGCEKYHEYFPKVLYFVKAVFMKRDEKLQQDRKSKENVLGVPGAKTRVIGTAKPRRRLRHR